MLNGMMMFARAGKPTSGSLAVRPRPTPRPTAAAMMSATKTPAMMYRWLRDTVAGGADSNDSDDGAAAALAVEASDMAADARASGRARGRRKPFPARRRVEALRERRSLDENVGKNDATS